MVGRNLYAKAALKRLSKKGKWAFGLSLFAGLAYLIFSPRIATRVYGASLFHPHRYPKGTWNVEELEGIKREDVWFKNKNRDLHGWFFHNPNATHTILFSHGNTGNLTGRPNYIRLLLKAGASVFIYDYRGYGRSPGFPTLSGICSDGIAAFDYLIEQRGLKPEQIVLYGESLGAAVTPQIAAKRDSAGIILQSGFASLRKIGLVHVPFTRIYPNLLFPQPGLEAAKVLANDPRPLLVLHGHKDKVVPYCHAEEIFHAAAEPKSFVCLLNAAHSDIYTVAADEYVSAVSAFLRDLCVTVANPEKTIKKMQATIKKAPDTVKQ